MRLKFIYLAIPIFLVYIFWHLFNKTNLSDFTILYDYRIASNLETPIRKSISECAKNKVFSAQKITYCLKEKYKIVNKIKIFHNKSQNSIISIEANRPIILINNKNILTDTGEIIPAEQYKTEACTNCFLVETYNKEIDLVKENEIYKFTKNLPAKIIENYDCFWDNKTLITLKNKFDPHFIIKAWHQTLFDSILISAINKLIRYINTKDGKAAQNFESFWTIDLRCKNQLILTEHKEKIKQ
jgi:hypothetical protein